MMRKEIILFLSILISTIASSQDCNIGNQDTLGFNSSFGGFQANYLLGVKFTLSEEGILNSVNLIGKNTESNVQMAVYNDLNAVPNELLVSTENGIVGEGIISLPVTPTQLQPGDYWVMAVYDSSAFHTYVDSTVIENVIYYKALNFGDPIPNNASDFLNYTGKDFTYFLEIECGIVNIDKTESDDYISLFPNPSSNIINISNLTEYESIIDVYDLSQKKVRTIKINSNNARIDISDLTKGTYLIIINNQLTRTIIKQ